MRFDQGSFERIQHFARDQMRERRAASVELELPPAPFEQAKRVRRPLGIFRRNVLLEEPAERDWFRGGWRSRVQAFVDPFGERLRLGESFPCIGERFGAEPPLTPEHPNL